MINGELRHITTKMDVSKLLVDSYPAIEHIKRELAIEIANKMLEHNWLRFKLETKDASYNEASLTFIGRIATEADATLVSSVIKNFGDRLAVRDGRIAKLKRLIYAQFNDKVTKDEAYQIRNIVEEFYQ